ncbi:hypothetical protein MKZ38_004220 [Zalerion maritima]|uniref:Uncharacterized protein n=1 Tax=Zalerion maritima TaxID=339359 RepID=A0AAD5RMK5_9PEZI|nr:hypothetical protein MKZ38_004220 [Zalerion maritima]
MSEGSREHLKERNRVNAGAAGPGLGAGLQRHGNRRKDVIDDDEESPLFIDDGNNIHYGSFNDQHMTGQEDPAEVQREIEALQRVVARTSDNMVDIFEITPQDNVIQPSTQYTYAGQDARMARYQHLLSKLSDNNDAGVQASVDWLGAEEDDNIEMERGGMSEPKLDEALVGTFADAAAA